MKYFLDTEFLEGSQKESQGYNIIFGIAFVILGLIAIIYGGTLYSLIAGILTIIIGSIHFFIGFSPIEAKPTIDLISIGIISEDDREYYAISKDFNLKEAWNRYQINTHLAIGGKVETKVYWIRDNVLKSIFYELIEKEYDYRNKEERLIGSKFNREFTYKNFKRLINKYGKSNKQIAKEIILFTYADYWFTDKTKINDSYPSNTLIKFYAYYADYDWVVFCWLFGRMIDLPSGFPMYCNDLKQMIDNKLEHRLLPLRGYLTNPNASLDSKLKEMKSYKNYPKQTNEHNALADAKWNKEFYKFLNSI